MSCDNPSWITYAIDGILFIAGFLCIVVMQKAEHDQQIRRIDALWIRNGRRISFIAIALFAWIMAATNSPYALFLLFITTAILLAIDAVALNQRPPNTTQSYLSSLEQLNRNDHQRWRRF